MPDINGNYLDTSRAKVKTSYTDKDVAKKPAPAMEGLYNAAEQARSEAENFKRLNPYGPFTDNKDLPMALAQQVLDATQTTSARLAHVDSDAAAAREQYRTAGDASPIAPFANAAKKVGGIGMFANMIPGGQVVGLPSEVLYGLGSAANAMDPFSHAGVGERLGEGLQAGLMAAPFAWRAAKGMNPTNFPSTVRGAESGSSEIPTGFSNKQSMIPAVEHYWDALDLGQTPGQALKIGAGRDKGAAAALQALQQAGRTAREGSVGPEAVSEVSAVPPAVARTVPTSDPLANFGRAHEAPGIDANRVFDEAGTPLGGQNRPLEALHPGAQAYIAREAAANAPLVEKLTSGWGARRTGRTSQELAALADVLSGKASAATTSPSLRGLVKSDIPHNLTMDIPEEAILNGDEASKRSVLFGGAGSKQNGAHVRPSKRTPVGAK